MQKIRFLVIVLAAFLIGGAGVYVVSPPQQDNRPRATGKALVGGPFELVTHTGKTVTDRDFRGRFMLVYFGYTFCPDVCPNDLSLITQALEELGEDAKKIVPLFITIDPERDTVAQMAEYVRNFHASLIGLTGTPAQIKQAARAYRVYYARPPARTASKQEATGEPTADTPAKTDGDYIMDHSAITFLMGPDGRYLAHFAQGTAPDVMARRLRALIR